MRTLPSCDSKHKLTHVAGKAWYSHGITLGWQERVEELAGTTFNSCMLNFYRSGLDHMGYHSDNERLYGSQPIIGMPFW